MSDAIPLMVNEGLKTADCDELIRFIDKTDDYVSRKIEDSIDDNPHGEPCDDESRLLALIRPAAGSIQGMADGAARLYFWRRYFQKIS